MKLRKPLKKQELEKEEKPKTLEMDSQQSFVRRYVKTNNELADEITSMETCKPYTPKQEGMDKETYNIMVCERYWKGDKVLLALSRERFEVISHKVYSMDDKEAEKNFEDEIDKAVLNPQRMIEIEDSGFDTSSMQQRPIRKKVPLDYLKEQRAKRETQEVEKGEGAEG